jgi:UDP-sugar transporter A1/2/3
MVFRLVTLAVQNAMLSVIMHYSRVDSAQSETYSAATAVLMVELLKGGISFAIAFSRLESAKSYPLNGLGTQQPSLLSPRALASRFRRLCKEIFRSDCWKLSIPAILYGELGECVWD